MIKTFIGRIVQSERNAVILIILILIALSLLPTFFQYLQTPPNSVYTFFHNSISDYPYYVSFIRQGTDGRLSTIDQFTSEPQTSGLVHVFYLSLGLIGRIFFLSPIGIYFISRVIFGVLYLLSGYLLIRYFINNKTHRVICFMMFSFSASFPNIVVQEKGFHLSQLLFWWTEIDPLRRATFIPHFLFGHICLLLCVYLLIRLFDSNKIKYLISAIILGFITGFAHPPSLGMVYYIFGTFILIRILYFTFFLRINTVKSLKFLITELLYFTLLILFTMPSLIYIYFTTGNIFPWTLMKAQESLFYYINTFEYIGALGIIFPIGILGIFVFNKIQISKYKKVNGLILFLWIFIDVVMVPLSKIIAFSHLILKIPTFANIRFLSMAIQLPLSIFSVYFIIYIKNHFNSYFYYSLLALFAFFTLLLYPSSIIWQLNDFAQAQNYLYPSKSIVSTFEFLNQKDNGKAVLARHDLSLLFPLFAKNIIYAGQAVYTKDNNIKKAQVDNFFQGKMTDGQVQDLIKIGNIGYIIAASENENKIVGKYKFLEKVYTSIGYDSVFRPKRNN
jgi:hypothetical protein